MPQPSLAARLQAGDTILSGWGGLADPLIGEAMARAGFEAVCLDCQHAFTDYEGLKASMLGIVAGGAAPVMRVPLGDFALGARALDLGFEAVIAPMINSVEDARNLVAGLKYPPLGSRSWGPSRPLHAWGMTPERWLAEANGLQLVFAMIETGDALDIAANLAAVDGIDGLFIGPNDLSISLNEGAKSDPEDAGVFEAIETVAAACAAHGKYATGYAQTPKIADTYRAHGFRYIACGSDYSYVRNSAARVVADFSG